jgi:threonine dehydrogenase-like Zn-dependent dehydrogenase
MRPLLPKLAPGKTVAVVGDGAVGLCGLIAARRLGPSRLLSWAVIPSASHWRGSSAQRTS